MTVDDDNDTATEAHNAQYLQPCVTCSVVVACILNWLNICAVSFGTVGRAYAKAELYS